MNKTTAIKMVNRGDRHPMRHKLHVAEHDGRMWATNGHWLAPADWFGVVLPEQRPGTFDAKTGEELPIEPPRISPLFPAEEGPILEPRRLGADGPAIIVESAHGDLRLYGDNEPTRLRRDYVDMFRDELAARRCGPMLLRQLKPPLGCIAVYSGSDYVTAGYERRTSWLIVGLIMPVRA